MDIRLLRYFPRCRRLRFDLPSRDPAAPRAAIPVKADAPLEAQVGSASSIAARRACVSRRQAACSCRSRATSWAERAGRGTHARARPTRCAHDPGGSLPRPRSPTSSRRSWRSSRARRRVSTSARPCRQPSTQRSSPAPLISDLSGPPPRGAGDQAHRPLPDLGVRAADAPGGWAGASFGSRIYSDSPVRPPGTSTARAGSSTTRWPMPARPTRPRRRRTSPGGAGVGRRGARHRCRLR